MIGVERSTVDFDSGMVTVAGKVNPTELCEWLKRNTRKDVQIIFLDPKMVCVALVY